MLDVDTAKVTRPTSRKQLAIDTAVARILAGSRDLALLGVLDRRDLGRVRAVCERVAEAAAP